MNAAKDFDAVDLGIIWSRLVSIADATIVLKQK